jgi:hypothetical protein
VKDDAKKEPGKKEPAKKEAAKKEAGKKEAPEAKQDPDDVPLEIVKPGEDKEGSGMKKPPGSNGQFTLEW